MIGAPTAPVISAITRWCGRDRPALRRWSVPASASTSTVRHLGGEVVERRATMQRTCRDLFLPCPLSHHRPRPSADTRTGVEDHGPAAEGALPVGAKRSGPPDRGPQSAAKGSHLLHILPSTRRTCPRVDVRTTVEDLGVVQPTSPRAQNDRHIGSRYGSRPVRFSQTAISAPIQPETRGNKAQIGKSPTAASTTKSTGVAAKMNTPTWTVVDCLPQPSRHLRILPRPEPPIAGASDPVRLICMIGSSRPRPARGVLRLVAR